MSRQRFISLLVAAVLALSAALYLSTQRNLPRDPQGGIFLPYLAKEMDTVSEVTLRKGAAAAAVTVQKRGPLWTVKERGDYPADLSKLRKLLLALSDAKIVEEKTSNPASFPIIGVADPGLPGSTGTEVSFVAQDGKHAVIVGKSVGEGNFARRGGENQSYIVEPAITIDAEPRAWIDAHLIDIAAATIQSIDIKSDGGAAYSVHRVKAGEDNFALEGVPTGRKAADPASLAPSSTTYSALTADDVAAASDIDFSKASVAVVTLSDGGIVTLTGVAVGDKHWIQLKSSKDAALTSKASGRAFELTGYRYDAIFRPLEQLLAPAKQPPASKPAVSTKPPAPTKLPLTPTS